MARGGKKGARAGRGAGGRGREKFSGIEKYGFDEADEVLKLHEDRVFEADEEADQDEFDDVEDEDVMAFDEEEEQPAKQPRGKAKKASAAKDGEEEDDVPRQGSSGKATTAGWRGQDFYGGDDAGDDSDNESEEELILEEARKLEEMRLQRCAEHEDILSSLMGAPSETLPSDAATASSAQVPGASGAAGLDAAAATAQFESVFAAEAETVERDLSQLSEGKKRGLMKKEAPELVPLLEDFKGKISHLQELLPLLSPTAWKRVPASGRAYLEAKASLLLSTLANLSFYLLMRAEGAGIRSHPVVSQLVWLRELHETLRPLDERLGPQLRKSLKAAKKVKNLEPETIGIANASSVAATPAEPKAPTAPKPHPSLRERLAKLKATLPTADLGKASAPAKTAPPARRREAATKDLLKLPARRKGAAAADAPLDLDDVDPTLGLRRLGVPIGEQLSSIQSQFRERAAKEQAVSADRNVEAKPRKTRERLSELPSPGPTPGNINQEAFADHDSIERDEDELLQKAKADAKTKKEKKSSQQLAKEAARVARQYHPEELVEGRRKTSKRILDNRGLVRQRKKKAGNARVANREKYDKLVKRRRGAVQDMREGSADGSTYAGEATGVRTHLKKSLKLG